MIETVEPDLDGFEATTPLRRRSIFQGRPGVMASALLLILLAASLFTDPAGYLLTDVGGKTASIEAMVERGDWDPDIGYWFAESDPDGTFYPYAHTTLTANGKWVNTTSLPLVYAARPLWAIGGARLALLLPLMGAVAAALAARTLERSLYPGNTGAASFWIIGLATPVVIYAMDLWEHSIGLAAMLLGVVGANEAAADRRPTIASLVAGLAFGLAATMRQEALVYGFVAGLYVLVDGRSGRAIVDRVRHGAYMAAGTLAMIAAHTVLEVFVLGGAQRLSRSTGTVAQTGGGLEDRARAAAATLLFPFNGDHLLSYVFGIGLLIGLAWTAHQVATRGTNMLPRLILLVSAVFCVLFYAMFGPRFVPGLVPTTPLAVIGVVAAIRQRVDASLLLAVALIPVPVMFFVQFPAGAIPQWGGRYMLLTGALLVIAAVGSAFRPGASAGDDDWSRYVRAVAVAGLAMTIFGMVWTGIRKDEITDDFSTVEQLTAGEVVVWRDNVDAREGGPQIVGGRWLSAPFEEQQALVGPALSAAGVESFVWIDEPADDPADVEEFFGYERFETVGFMDFLEHELVRYVRTDN